MFEAITEDISTDRAADYVIVASFIARARSGDPPPITVRFVDGRDAESSLSGFVEATSPCALKGIYAAVRGGPDTPIFAEWDCPSPAPIMQAGFRIKNGQIEQIKFGPRGRVYLPSPGLRPR